MKTFYLFRHGDTNETKNHLVYGKNIFTAPIIPEAKIYIQKMGEFLKMKSIDFFACSEIPRCKQTSEIISKIIKISHIIDIRLSEYDPDSSYTPETFAEFLTRVSSLMLELESCNYRHIAVCGHGSGIAALTNLIRFGRFSPEDLLDYPAPGIIWIIKNKKRNEINFT